VLTSAAGVLAALAAEDFPRTGAREVFALEGGTAAWREAGYSLERGAGRMATAPDDIRGRAREQSENVEEAMRAYLSWEIALADQMVTDDDQRFRIPIDLTRATL